MVRDAVLRRGHCQGGDGESQQCKMFINVYYYIKGRIFRMVSVCHLFVSNHQSLLFSEKIHARVWEYKRPNLFHANRHARLWHKQEGSYCCQWGKYTQTHTQMYRCTFIGPISCGRHDRELIHVSEQSVSQRVRSDAGTHCIVPTHALHDWEIYIWFSLLLHILSV